MSHARLLWRIALCRDLRRSSAALPVSLPELLSCSRWASPPGPSSHSRSLLDPCSFVPVLDLPAGPLAGSVVGGTPAKPQSHWQISLMLHSALSPLKPSSALLAGNPWKVKGVNGARVAHDHVGTRGGPIPGTRHGTRFEHIKWQWVDDIMDEPNGGATTEGTMAAAAAARAVRVLAAPRAAIVPPVGCVLLWQTTRGSRVYR
jgi:hypothetical protein